MAGLIRIGGDEDLDVQTGTFPFVKVFPPINLKKIAPSLPINRYLIPSPSTSTRFIDITNMLFCLFPSRIYGFSILYSSYSACWT